MATETIEHEGVVTRIAPQQITVVIQSNSACAGCHAKGACNLSGSRVKEIIAEKPDFDIAVGSRVQVTATIKNAMLSVFLAYIIPSILLIGVLASLLWIGWEEVYAAIGSLAVIAIYFFLIYLLRRRLSGKIKFKVKEAQP